MKAYSHRGALHGTMTVPGGKAHTIRSVMLGTLAGGTSTIHNPLDSKDGLAALNTARMLGADVKVVGNNESWIITGVNGRPKAPAGVIDTQNSGTTTSFSIGIASLVDGYVVITGDEQICRRPWRVETKALEELGATCIHTRIGNVSPPVVVGGPMHGGVAHLDGLNSQHISGIILVAPMLNEGESVELHVDHPLEQPYIQLTIDWVKKYGGTIEYTPDYKYFKVKGGQHYTAQEIFIHPDWSSVVFPLVAAVCTPSDLTITGVNFEDTQGDKEVVNILIRMGADITKDEKNETPHIRGGKPLHGVEIDMNAIPDSLPILTVAAAYAEGDTHFINLAHVRIKESDRVAVMSETLAACGAEVESTHDTMTVHGGKPLHGATVPSYGDHRVAMAMAVCGLMCDGEMEILDDECAAVSFPRFYEKFNEVGADFALR